MLILVFSSVDGASKYDPTKNYCGPDADLSVSVPRDPVGVDFNPACYIHDKCYGACCKTQSYCDKEFRDNMKDFCKAERKGAALLECYSAAETYYTAVSSIGDWASYDCTEEDYKNMDCVCPRGNEWEWDDPSPYHGVLVTEKPMNTSNQNVIIFTKDYKMDQPNVIRLNLTGFTSKLDIILVLDVSSSMGEEMLLPGTRNLTTLNILGGQGMNATTILIPCTEGMNCTEDRRMKKIDAAKISAKSILNSITSDERVGIVSFASKTNLLAGLGSDKNSTTAAIDSLTEKGNTAIGQGIMSAVDEFDRASGARDKKLAILLTDGYSNAGATTPLEAARLARMSRVKVCTIGFGDKGEFNERLLREIACETECGFYHAKDANELILSFLDVHSKAEGYSTKKLEKSYTITKEGETMSFDFEIYGDDRVAKIIMQQLKFSNLDVEVYDPENRRITASDPGVTYSGAGSHPEYYIIENPKPGKWRVVIVGQDVPYDIPFVVYAATKPSDGLHGEADAKGDDTLMYGLAAASVAFVLLLFAALAVAAFAGAYLLKRFKGRKTKP